MIKHWKISNPSKDKFLETLHDIFGGTWVESGSSTYARINSDDSNIFGVTNIRVYEYAKVTDIWVDDINEEVIFSSTTTTSNASHPSDPTSSIGINGLVADKEGKWSELMYSTANSTNPGAFVNIVACGVQYASLDDKAIIGPFMFRSYTSSTYPEDTANHTRALKGFVASMNMYPVMPRKQIITEDGTMYTSVAWRLFAKTSSIIEMN